MLLPITIKKKSSSINPDSQIDERDIMFSRQKLTGKHFKQYYKNNPGKKSFDDRFRKNPGLLDNNAIYYSCFSSEAAKANFDVTQHLREITHPPIKKTAITPQKNKVTTFIKNWLLNNGAIDVGFCQLEDYHFYSHHGYAPNYGEEVNTSHKYAIVFLVEMDQEMIGMAPKAPTVLESSQQYLKSAGLAVPLAHFITNLGHDAQAHIDGKYDIVAPLVARDCGLGEIGRMGLLISHKLGPRVRIAAVTTNLPLVLSDRNFDPSVEQFCDVCKKCATICPSNAIPFESKQKINTVNRWQINQEKCFTYWTKIGTDCGRCIQVCPYSHPNNLFHNIIRFSIKHFPVFRRYAAFFDDLLYGKKPKPRKQPTWLKNN